MYQRIVHLNHKRFFLSHCYADNWESVGVTQDVINEAREIEWSTWKKMINHLNPQNTQKAGDHQLRCRAGRSQPFAGTTEQSIDALLNELSKKHHSDRDRPSSRPGQLNYVSQFAISHRNKPMACN
jgi:hypothetical protein